MRCPGCATVRAECGSPRRARGELGYVVGTDCRSADARPLLDTYDRPLATLEVIGLEAERVGKRRDLGLDTPAGLDVIDFAEEPQMPDDDDTERRRQVIQARVEDLDHRI